MTFYIRNKIKKRSQQLQSVIIVKIASMETGITITNQNKTNNENSTNRYKVESGEFFCHQLNTVELNHNSHIKKYHNILFALC